MRLYVNASDVEPVGFSGQTRVIEANRLWTLRGLSAEMRHDPPDLLFVPAHVIPPVHPATVVTIHDVGFRRFPETYSRKRLLELEASTRWSLRAAARIIAVSNQTRDDLVSLYDVDPDRIVVVHHGVDQRFVDAGRVPAPLSDRFSSIRRPFVLSVGTIQPRKNYPTLVRGFEIASGDGLNHDLVIVGKRGWMADQTLDLIARSPVRDRIHWLEYIPLDDLIPLYTNADMVVVPSLYEGFGLPVLEAMATGVPVITSDTPALVEIAGGAALHVDAMSASGFSIAMQRVAGDNDLAARLGESGRERAGEFSWERSALATERVLRYVIER